jgi:hypothetical protein
MRRFPCLLREPRHETRKLRCAPIGMLLVAGRARRCASSWDRSEVGPRLAAADRRLEVLGQPAVAVQNRRGRRAPWGSCRAPDRSRARGGPTDYPFACRMAFVQLSAIGSTVSAFSVGNIRATRCFTPPRRGSTPSRPQVHGGPSPAAWPPDWSPDRQLSGRRCRLPLPATSSCLPGMKTKDRITTFLRHRARQVREGIGKLEDLGNPE